MKINRYGEKSSVFSAMKRWLQWQRKFQKDKESSADVVSRIEKAREDAQVQTAKREQLALDHERQTRADITQSASSGNKASHGTS